MCPGRYGGGFWFLVMFYRNCIARLENLFRTQLNVFSGFAVPGLRFSSADVVLFHFFSVVGFVVKLLHVYAFSQLLRFNILLELPGRLSQLREIQKNQLAMTSPQT